MKYFFVFFFLNSAWGDAGAITNLSVPSQMRYGIYDPVKPNRYGDLCIPGEAELISEDGHSRIQLNERESITLVSQIDVVDGDCNEVTDVKSSGDHQKTTIRESTVRRCGNAKPVAVESREWTIEPGHVNLKSTDLIDPKSGSYNCEWRLRLRQ